MKFFPLLTTFLALSSAQAATFLKGFNLPAQNPDGTCKTQADWKADFLAMQALPGGFPNARLFASSDCNTLVNAVPAAIATKTKLLVGVWTQDWNHFNNEKSALLTAIKQYGSAWMLACSVGSEDLYRGETSASTLAGQIYDVRGMLGTVSKGISVGHVDTWVHPPFQSHRGHATDNPNRPPG
jgi:glucan endo-1,3-beta-D-glucosidase